MPIEVTEIRIPEHLVNLRCTGMKEDQPCGWSQIDTNVNTDPQVSYNIDPMQTPPGVDKNYIRIVCPNCGSVTTYPTFDERNHPGYLLGQAKTA